jgi:uncharacterized membrane protein (UPF0136 family)
MIPFIFIGFIVLVLLNIFDYYSTSVLLSNGFYEANPIVAYLMYHFGEINGLVIAKVTAFILLTYVSIKIIKNKHKLTKREKTLSIGGYIIMISYYSYFMYFYNYKFLMAVVQ